MAHSMSTIILCAVIHSVALLKFSVGIDILFPNQTFAMGQTLISQNQIFEMGFFSPGASRKGFLGIWYRNTPDVVVWVANRNNPITDSQGVRLAIVGNGTLVISSAGGTIWSAKSSGVASNPILQLLDTGNLVLADMTDEGLLRSYIWQGFDHPTDTWLPGMKLVDDIDAGVEKYLTSWSSSDDPSPGDLVFKIHNQGLPELVLLSGTTMKYRTGKWNGLHFNGGPRFPNPVFKPQMVFKGERLISITEIYDNSTVKRITLEKSGSFKSYSMNARRDKWNHAFSSARDVCDEYGECGPNSICRIRKAVRCECLKGFAPKSPKDWDLQDWSGGCTRIKPLNCQSGDDGFHEIRGVNYPDLLQFWLNKSISLSECKAECLRNGSCVAYANPYVNDGGSGCLMWFGDLIDTRDLGTNNYLTIYIRVPRSELDSSTDLEEEKNKSPTKIIVMSIVSGVLASGFINGGILFMTRRKRQAAKRNSEDLELPSFKLASILAATNNFSRENIIGEGGFGSVYKGKLLTEEEIAVKRLSRTSRQGIAEFKNEVMLIAKLQHRNLVRLLGCCIDGEERMLIYEYMPNKSLDYFVFDQNRRTLLTWPIRFDIILGIAKGLLYLHHDSRLKIIHRDLKTSNILLDGNWNPKISDFGLARIFAENQSIARTRRVVGTYGYMSPEYAIAGKFSEKSDIFSLGVVLLEVVSGKKNRAFDNCDHYNTLLGHAWLLWKENKTLELMDECLNSTVIESQVKRCVQVSLLCVQKFAEDRPVMSSVHSMLATDGEMLPDPKEPGFFTGRSSCDLRSSDSTFVKSERETMSITDLEAR